MSRTLSFFGSGPDNAQMHLGIHIFRICPLKCYELCHLFGRGLGDAQMYLGIHIFRTLSLKCHVLYYLNVTNSFIWQWTRRRADVLGIHILQTSCIKSHELYRLNVTNSIIYLAGGLDDAYVYLESTYSELYGLNVTNSIVQISRTLLSIWQEDLTTWRCTSKQHILNCII